MCNYYCDNLPKIIENLNKINYCGILAQNSKKVIHFKKFSQSFCEIKSLYNIFFAILDNFKNQKLNIESGFHILSDVSLFMILLESKLY